MKWTPVAAITAILILTIVALAMGYDGIGYASSVVVISGLGGYSIRAYQDKKKEAK